MSAILRLIVFIYGVRGHGAITSITGVNGISGSALAIDPSTPRTGSGARPFQRDTSVIRNSDIASGATSACGKTKEGGSFDMVEATDKIMSANGGLPSVKPGGEVTMTLHQINQDGAGPYSCDFSLDGGEFKMMEVTRNVPGVAGLSIAQVVDLPLTVKIPNGMGDCKGGSNGATCIIRCRNSAIAGPFGGCVPVMMDNTFNNATGSAMNKRGLGGMRREIYFADLDNEVDLFRRLM